MTHSPSITMDCQAVTVTVTGSEGDSLEDVADIVERLSETAVQRLDDANHNLMQMEEENGQNKQVPEGRSFS